jgi:hypothetical protein
MPRVVTLTTDFGTGSDYVAQLKGRLLHARAPVTLEDLAHDLPPHDVRAAAWLVGQACPTFPADTLHVVVVVVVDPGMGTARRLAWARIGGQEFLARQRRALVDAPSRAARGGPCAGRTGRSRGDERLAATVGTAVAIRG